MISQTNIRGVSREFQEASGSEVPKRRKKPAPFSLRLSADERANLQAQAGGRPLGAFIRERLLGDQAEKRRIQRKPRIDDKQAAMLLAELGHSRLSSNLNQLAKHANTGSLDVSPEVERELHDAYLAERASARGRQIRPATQRGGLHLRSQSSLRRCEPEPGRSAHYTTPARGFRVGRGAHPGSHRGCGEHLFVR